MTDFKITEKEIFVECPRCQIMMSHLGKIPFRIGGMDGTASVFWGGWADASERIANLDIYRCGKCKN